MACWLSCGVCMCVNRVPIVRIIYAVYTLEVRALGVCCTAADNAYTVCGDDSVEIEYYSVVNSNTSLHSKHHIAELPLRAGFKRSVSVH